MPDLVEISGRVADATSGLALPGVEVRAIARMPRPSRLLARAETDAHGGFRLGFETAASRLAPPREPLDPDPVPLPGPRAEEIVHLAVYRGDALLPAKDTGDTRWDGRPEVVLLVDAGRPTPPAPDPEPEAEPEPVALTITELGEALAVTAASIQQELAHYPTANGAFVLDDLDIEIPAAFGVDRLGQLRVDVGAPANGASAPAGRLRLRVKPLLEPPEPRSVTAPQALDALAVLSTDVIAKLHAQRVYTVGDLLRISRNPAGRKALDELGVPLVEGLRARAEVVALPTVPSRIAESLVRVGVFDPKAFVDADATQLAERLSEHVGERLDVAQVIAWQARTRPLVTIAPEEV